MESPQHNSPLGPLIGSARPLLEIKTAAQVENEPSLDKNAEAVVVDEPTFTEMGRRVQRTFEAAWLFRSQAAITQEFIKSQLQRQGTYDPDEQGQIARLGGCQQYFNITRTKCEAGEAWLDEFMQEPPYGLDPTPVPTLPEDDEKLLFQKAMQFFRDTMAQGIMPTPMDTVDTMLRVYDQWMADVRLEAKEKADRHWLKIQDQLVEGGFPTAWDEFKHNLFTYPFAVLKKEKRLVQRSCWEKGKIKTKLEAINCFYAPSPHDTYLAPNARNSEEGPICETRIFKKSDLMDMIGKDGWFEDAIRQAVGIEGASTYAMILPGAAERAALENKLLTHYGGVSPDVVFAVETHMSVLRDDLIRAKVPEDQLPKDRAYFNVKVIQVANWTLHVSVNTDPAANRGYWITSAKKVPGTHIGVSTPAAMRDCQYGVNGIGRATFNNLAYASGPMGEVDVNALAPGENPVPRPWKFFQVDGQQLGGRQHAVSFFQVDPFLDELGRQWERFEAMADDRTGIPHYVHGNEDMGGAARTASGLSMLMQSGNKQIKRVLKNVGQDVYAPMIKSLYDENMRDLDDKEWRHIKGDCQIVPRDMMSILLRDARREQAINVWDRVKGDPVAMQIMGLEGHAEFLRKVFEDLRFDTQIIPEKDELARRLEEIRAQQAAQQQAQLLGGEGAGETQEQAPTQEAVA